MRGAKLAESQPFGVKHKWQFVPFQTSFVLCSVVEPFDCSIPNALVQEEEIVERWKQVLNTNNYEKNDKIHSVLHEEFQPEVDLVDIKQGSVRCYLLCRTPTALNTLYHKLENGSLTNTLQSIFSLLLGGKDIVQVGRTKGRLSASELQRRVEVFRKDLGMMYLTFFFTVISSSSE